MKRFKKSILSCCLTSVLMLGDFDPPTAIDEQSYDNAKQSLSSLTDFSGWSLGLNEAEAGCGDNNSCSNDYDTMVIIGDPIDDGWDFWDWEWNLGDAWDQYWDDYWNDQWADEFGDEVIVDRDHCLARVSSAVSTCFNTANTGSGVVVATCLAMVSSLGPLGAGICGVGGVISVGGTHLSCDNFSTAGINMCHQNFPANNSSSGGSSSNGGDTGNGNYSGGSYNGDGDFGGNDEYGWAIP